jgi:ATP-dependent Lhr-like helicase
MVNNRDGIVRGKKLFHPVIQEWLQNRFGQPTEPQVRAWPLIAADESVLIAAPTGAGKTMAAFLVLIDRLLRHAIAGTLSEEVSVVYVSPLRALSNDVQRNLEEPLREILELARARGFTLPEIRSAVRTGDTTQSERVALLKRPPHILVTTPESLYLLVTTEKGRGILKTVRTVILDEIHAIARDKRGSHLMLTIERLQELAGRRLQRIGVSATQRPMTTVARFLMGQDAVNGSERPCAIVECKMTRDLDLAVHTTESELSAICSHDQWDEIHQSLADLIHHHRSSIVFVNTRRMAERLAYRLGELVGEGAIECHHGSMSKTQRFQAEQKLKNGQLKAVIATASLELGIDVGYIDLVVQIGSPRSISAFMQRVGRSGHSLGLVPKGRLVPLTRDELLECAALIMAARRDLLDITVIPEAPKDILAQQIVASAASRDWNEVELFDVLRSAYPFRDLTMETFRAVLSIAAEGMSKNRKHGKHVYWDQINGTVKGRRGARLAAVTCGGAIPDLAEYRVVTEDGTFVGSVDEEFAIESTPGDVFLLGNMSWMIHRVKGGQVIVHDAGGAPASVPFWQGEAPGRSFELSQVVGDMRQLIADHIDLGTAEQAWEIGRTLQPDEEQRMTIRAKTFLTDEMGLSETQAKQLSHYVAAQLAATGTVPTCNRMVIERFMDETGGMQLVFHAPFGSRVTRAWGFAMRKRYCRTFDFELQAQADDNGFVLAMGPLDGFPLDTLKGMVNPNNSRALLEQAMLQVPLFPVRFRWNVTRALAVPRMNGGKKVPPHLQRFRSEELMTSVFPQQTMCLEHVTGDIEIPNHPIVQQSMHDCLHEALDFVRWNEVLQRVQNGDIEVITTDLREPSPFSYELIHANPYAFLDDAPLEERRARAVNTRRGFRVDDMRDLAALDQQAIAVVRDEAWPVIRDADELHDVLMQAVAFPQDELHAQKSNFETLQKLGRASSVNLSDGRILWYAAENQSKVLAVYSQLAEVKYIELPAQLQIEIEQVQALQDVLRGRLEVLSPLNANQLALDLGLKREDVESSLPVLESQGIIVSGHFTAAKSDERQWCDRRLLSRMHRLTVEGLRQKIKPVSLKTFASFLLEHQCVHVAHQKQDAAGAIDLVDMFQGYELPASAWESEFFASRLKGYREDQLDQMFLSGAAVWQRIPHGRTHKDDESRKTHTHSFNKTTTVALFQRSALEHSMFGKIQTDEEHLSGPADRVFSCLKQRGALFLEEIQRQTNLLRSQLEEAMRELVSRGIVTSDGFDGLRSLVQGSRQADRLQRRFDPAGRWYLVRNQEGEIDADARAMFWAELLLKRYGVVFRDIIERERLAPRWSEISQKLRRMEARGLVRGGCFVEGVSGEQFALPHAVDRLRALRDEGKEFWCIIAAVDPCFVPCLFSSVSVPSLRRNRVVIKNGEVIATFVSDEITWLQKQEMMFTATVERAVRQNALTRQRDPFSMGSPDRLPLQRSSRGLKLSQRLFN